MMIKYFCSTEGATAIFKKAAVIGDGETIRLTFDELQSQISEFKAACRDLNPSAVQEQLREYKKGIEQLNKLRFS